MIETIKINGMTCGGCVASVRNALARVGVVGADVEIGSAKLEYDDSQVTHHQIVEAIEDAGFDVVETVS